MQKHQISTLTELSCCLLQLQIEKLKWQKKAESREWKQIQNYLIDLWILLNNVFPLSNQTMWWRCFVRIYVAQLSKRYSRFHATTMFRRTLKMWTRCVPAIIKKFIMKLSIPFRYMLNVNANLSKRLELVNASHNSLIDFDERNLPAI